MLCGPKAYIIYKLFEATGEVKTMLGQFVPDHQRDGILPYERGLLDILLFDRSTRRNIVWATEDYSSFGETYAADAEIAPELIAKGQTLLIRPRTEKALEEQQARVREKAEVFTPAWVCNQQNNLIDEAWFGRKDVFNRTDGTIWMPVDEPIPFPEKGSRTWKHYVDTKRMEITCGEAPYLVSRSDVTTGEMLPVQRRIGLLDRKLRIVHENTASEVEWITWAIRAVQSVYGFEYHGDSLLLARMNVFLTFLDYYDDRYHRLPEKKLMELVARIISWNLWQMDGMKFVSPCSCKPLVHEEYSLFGKLTIMEPCPGCKDHSAHEHTGVYCKIMDWRAKQSCRYIDLLKGVKQHDRI